jgi:plasmid stability protein
MPASLTIRNLDEAVKTRLRVRAAARGRSMEAEARAILSAALSATAEPGPSLVESIRRRFAGLGDVELPITVREPVREPPELARAATKRPARAARKR